MELIFLGLACLPVTDMVPSHGCGSVNSKPGLNHIAYLIDLSNNFINSGYKGGERTCWGEERGVEHLWILIYQREKGYGGKKDIIIFNDKNESYWISIVLGSLGRHVGSSKGDCPSAVAPLSLLCWLIVFWGRASQLISREGMIWYVLLMTGACCSCSRR